MDVLSQFLSLYTPQGSLDARCDLSAPWTLDHHTEAPGVASWHVIVSGGATLLVAGRAPVALAAGDIVVLPRGCAHRLLATHAGIEATAAGAVRAIAADQAGLPVTLKTNDGAGAGTDILCGRFQFTQPAGQPLFAAMPQLLVVSTAGREEFAGLQALGAMLRAESAQMRPGAQLLVAQLSSVLFALLVRAWTEQAGLSHGMLGVLAEPRLQPALLGMFADMARPWTLNDMARSCHMSRATFVRLFQQAAQASPAATLQQIRMARAAYWLSHDNRPVIGISEAVGYQSEAAFSRAFKKSFGVSPGQYRRQFRAG